MTRQTGSTSWSEEHFVVFVHDVYRSKKHGRVIEFYAEQGGYRVVPLSCLRVTEASEKKINQATRGAKLLAARQAAA